MELVIKGKVQHGYLQIINKLIYLNIFCVLSVLRKNICEYFHDIELRPMLYMPFQVHWKPNQRDAPRSCI